MYSLSMSRLRRVGQRLGLRIYIAWHTGPSLVTRRNLPAEFCHDRLETQREEANMYRELYA